MALASEYHLPWLTASANHTQRRNPCCPPVSWLRLYHLWHTHWQQVLEHPWRDAANCHERKRSNIRTIRKRLRICIHCLPFKHLPKHMSRHMDSDAVRCLNRFPKQLKSSAAPALPTTPPCALNLAQIFKSFRMLNPHQHSLCPFPGCHHPHSHW